MCDYKRLYGFFISFPTTAFQFTTNEPQSYVLGGRNHPLHITSQYEIFDEYADDLSKYQSRILPDNNADSLCWCYICCDCKIIGSLWIERNSEKKAILGIFIADKDYRGKGIGNKAIKIAIEKTSVSELYLNVRVNNQRAINCYHKVGFTDVRQYTKDNGIEVIEMNYKKRT